MRAPRKPRMVPSPTPADGARIPVDAEILAIDPGLLHPAAARFRLGKLVAATRTHVPNTTHAWAGQRCLELACWMTAWVVELDLPSIEYVVLEWPQWYPETKSGGVDPNDLGGLLAMGGMVIGRLAEHLPSLEVLSPTPAQVWNSLPKSTTGDPWASKRGARIKERLSPAEFASVVRSHDAIDAVGLGLWAIGRLERHRVFPGAT